MLNVKDSRWLQLEVCREFQRNKCTRPDTECKFAHPPAQVEVQNGRVTACYDSIKGRCNREKPPCKYFHPPQHLKDQLLINGRNHLALKNALMQQMGMSPGQPMLPGQLQALETEPCYFQASPYLGVHQLSGAYPFVSASPVLQMMTQDAASLGVVPTTVMAAAPAQNGTKVTRTDRIEGFPGMVQYKRTAGDKSGVPVYQPATAYQQAALMQLQQPFVPVSCEYTATSQVESNPSEPKADHTASQTDNTDNREDQRASITTVASNLGYIVTPSGAVKRDAESLCGGLGTPAAASAATPSYSAASGLLQTNPFAAAFNPLSYTGLSLNKQLSAVQQQAQQQYAAGLQMQYPGLVGAQQLQGLTFPGVGGMQGYLPIQAMNQQLQFLQPGGAAAFAGMSPYALLGGLSGMGMVPGLVQTTPATPSVIPTVPGAASAVSPTVAAAQAAAIAQAGLNPYKKMRTM